eukprot:COSAG01_NODE_6000_length_3908_cov_4.117616_5_plen_101_part_00
MGAVAQLMALLLVLVLVLVLLLLFALFVSSILQVGTFDGAIVWGRLDYDYYARVEAAVRVNSCASTTSPAKNACTRIYVVDGGVDQRGRGTRCTTKLESS